MTPKEIFDAAITILSGVIAGVIVAVVNYYLTREKTKAEIAKLNAETEQIISSKVEGVSAKLDYRLDNNKDQVIFDSTKSGRFRPFKGVEGQFWSGRENTYVGPTGHGVLSQIDEKDGLLLEIKRTDTVGRFEIWLQQYNYNNDVYDCIPKNALITGKRKIRVRCEAKVDTGEHRLVFILRDKATAHWLASRREKITVTENWTSLDLFFEVEPMADIQFRIDDQEISIAPSHVYIKNFLLTEKLQS